MHDLPFWIVRQRSKLRIAVQRNIDIVRKSPTAAEKVNEMPTKVAAIKENLVNKKQQFNVNAR